MMPADPGLNLVADLLERGLAGSKQDLAQAAEQALAVIRYRFDCTGQEVEHRPFIADE